MAGLRSDDGIEYGQQTPGIPAKKYADKLYMRIYVKNTDGEYVYSNLISYSVRDYCEGRLAYSTNAKMKNLCASILHYGTAAQKNFGYNIGDLANKNILSDYPVAAWDASVLDALQQPNTRIVGTGTVKDNGKTLSLDGEVRINFYFGLDSSVGTPTTAELLFWNKVSGELTEDNAQKINLIYANKEYGQQSVSGSIPAKEFGKTVYACAHFVDAEGNHHYSNVLPYSAEEYAAGRIANSSDQNLITVMKTMVQYGEAAKAYFTK